MNLSAEVGTWGHGVEGEGWGASWKTWEGGSRV